MALISKSKAGRIDGGYSRVLGNPAIGALISRVQATVISSGTELEKTVTRKAENGGMVMTAAQLGQFLSGTLGPGHYLLTKKLIKDHLKQVIQSDIEPDFVYLVIDVKTAYIIELKDGDAFDTKKSAGEVLNLKTFAATLHTFLLQKGLPFKVKVKVCCFNQSDKTKIVAGLKGKITEAEAMTGKELCDLLGLDYQAIVAEREADAKANFEYFLGELIKIPDVQQCILKLTQPLATATLAP